jgi:TolB-like protein
MRAYAGRGERGMAIQAYERCRAALADQLDANPSEETQRLAAEIRAAAPVLRPSAGFATATTARPDLRFTETRVADPRPPLRAEPRPDVRPDGRPEGRQEARPAQPRVGPRVGVLPLQPIGVSEAEVQLATGLADEITAELARFRWMSLVSSGSLGRFAAQTRDEAAIRRAANIDFLLDGTIQRVPDRLRVALRLLDLRAGNQVVWSHRFDRDVTDLLTLQDDVAAEVAARIDAEIRLIEAQRATARPAADATAYDLVLRAFPLMSRLDRAQFMQAGDLLRRAIAQEPDNPAAHAWLACWHIVLFLQAWSGDPAGVVTEGARLATRAVMLDPQDARSLTIAGHVRAVLNRRPRESLSLHERALTLNPNLGMAWAFSGAAFACLGDLPEAERRMRRYKALSPLDPHACFHDVVFVLIALLRHDHEAAVAAGREVSEMNPAYAAAYKPYLAALGHLGHDDEAALARQRLLAVEPGFTIARFFEASPLARAEDRDHCAAGLRLANVPEA